MDRIQRKNISKKSVTELQQGNEDSDYKGKIKIRNNKEKRKYFKVNYYINAVTPMSMLIFPRAKFMV